MTFQKIHNFTGRPSVRVFELERRLREHFKDWRIIVFHPLLDTRKKLKGLVLHNFIGITLSGAGRKQARNLAVMKVENPGLADGIATLSGTLEVSREKHRGFKLAKGILKIIGEIKFRPRM